METNTKLELGGKKYELRKWPLRPGFKIAQGLTAIAADVMAVLGTNTDNIELGSIDFAKIAGVISDENVDLVVEILVEGLAFKERDKARETVEALTFEDSCVALEAVLKFNVSFLMARLANLKQSSETSTPPAQS